MERKDFLKNGMGFLGMALLSPSLIKFDDNNVGNACKVTRTEMEGPFPTKIPANFLKQNIIDNRTGVPFKMEISFKNTNQNCEPIWGLIVDIWQCDKDGYYSEYGGPTNPFQTKDMTREHFLRGRQLTNRDGVATFDSIFPGWYQGRATHIHVHAYAPNGRSVLITQIAFPEDQNSAVVAVNNSTANGYTKGMRGYTYWQQDEVFRDGISDELATVTGSIAAGYLLTHTIYVSAPVSPTGVDEIAPEGQFSLGTNFPNPFSTQTTIPVTLLRKSDVKIEVLDLQGRKITEVVKEGLNHGISKIPLDLSSFNLADGRYIYSVEVNNENGTFRQSKIMLKNSL